VNHLCFCFFFGLVSLFLPLPERVRAISTWVHSTDSPHDHTIPTLCSSWSPCATMVYPFQLSPSRRPRFRRTGIVFRLAHLPFSTPRPNSSATFPPSLFLALLDLPLHDQTAICFWFSGDLPPGKTSPSSSDIRRYLRRPDIFFPSSSHGFGPTIPKFPSRSDLRFPRKSRFPPLIRCHFLGNCRMTGIDLFLPKISPLQPSSTL